MKNDSARVYCVIAGGTALLVAFLLIAGLSQKSGDNSKAATSDADIAAGVVMKTLHSSGLPPKDQSSEVTTSTSDDGSTISLIGTKELDWDVHYKFDRVEIANGYKDCGGYTHPSPQGAVYLIVYYSATSNFKQTRHIKMPVFVIRTDDEFSIVEDIRASGYISRARGPDELGTSNCYLFFQPTIPVECVAAFQFPSGQLGKHPLLCLDAGNYDNAIPLWRDRSDESLLVINRRKEEKEYAERKRVQEAEEAARKAQEATQAEARAALKRSSDQYSEHLDQVVDKVRASEANGSQATTPAIDESTTAVPSTPETSETKSESK